MGYYARWIVAMFAGSSVIASTDAIIVGSLAPLTAIPAGTLAFGVGIPFLSRSVVNAFEGRSIFSDGPGAGRRTHLP